MYPEYDNRISILWNGNYELPNNHLDFMKNNKDIQKYNIIVNKNSPKLVISHIIKGSKLSEDNIQGTINIRKVNNININTIKELKKAFRNIKRMEI